MNDEEVILRFSDGMAKWVGKLIRCKDCKYYEKFVNGVGFFCSNDRYADECEEPTEEDFCSWAERREEDETN